EINWINQNEDIVFAINKLTDSIEKSNNKNSIFESVVSSILAQISVKLICGMMMFLVGLNNPNKPIILDNNIEVIKKEITYIDLKNQFHNTLRTVTKDELKVRVSDKMKSNIKYTLKLGDVVKVEHKNRNWTKVVYTNKFTNEKEIGWVLTRYIKRFD